MTSPRVLRALLISAAVLAIAILFGLWSGYQHVTVQSLRTDPMARALFFRVRFRWWARRSRPCFEILWQSRLP
jgi:hypothetical protein